MSGAGEQPFMDGSRFKSQSKPRKRQRGFCCLCFGVWETEYFVIVPKSVEKTSRRGPHSQLTESDDERKERPYAAIEMETVTRPSSEEHSDGVKFYFKDWTSPENKAKFFLVNRHESLLVVTESEYEHYGTRFSALQRRSGRKEDEERWCIIQITSSRERPERYLRRSHEHIDAEVETSSPLSIQSTMTTSLIDEAADTLTHSARRYRVDAAYTSRHEAEHDPRCMWQMRPHIGHGVPVFRILSHPDPHHYYLSAQGYPRDTKSSRDKTVDVDVERLSESSNFMVFSSEM